MFYVSTSFLQISLSISSIKTKVCFENEGRPRYFHNFLKNYISNYISKSLIKLIHLSVQIFYLRNAVFASFSLLFFFFCL